MSEIKLMAHDEPVYRQVAQRLADLIRRGAWEPGAKIPSERELAEEFRISRMTARAAVDLLVSHGLVHRRGRLGVFVAPPKVVYDVTTADGLHDQLRKAGLIPGASVWGATTVVVSQLPEVVGASLGLGRRARVHQVLRVRTANGEPVALEHSYFPAAIFPGLLECDLTASIYGLMRERFDRAPVRSVQEIDVLPLGIEAAEILGTSPDAPSLSVERCSWDSTGVPVEYARDTYRSDRIRLRSSSGPGALGALSAQAIGTYDPPPPPVRGDGEESRVETLEETVRDHIA